MIYCFFETGRGFNSKILEQYQVTLKNASSVFSNVLTIKTNCPENKIERLSGSSEKISGNSCDLKKDVIIHPVLGPRFFMFNSAEHKILNAYQF